MRCLVYPLFTLTLLLCPTDALAGPPLVPPQLLAACAKLAPGAPCTVRFQDKTLTGVCQELPDHSHACLPAKRAHAPKPPGKPR
ncbi:MAG: hypothetical protein JWN04_1905 [Myxococcaceae bacterium]|nr:hypothetical protein [Myxococcaceae bacterium]